MALVGSISQNSNILNSRRECMFIEKQAIFCPIPKGLYVKIGCDFTYNPFGIEVHFFINFYKHIFPLGM
jgi:hypothetical protein